jgi:N-carbamoylputrescine amidase
LGAITVGGVGMSASQPLACYHRAMSDATLTIALIQHPCPVEQSKQATLDHACALIRTAAARGAQLVVTQELFTTPYFPQVEDGERFNLAEPIPGPTTQRLGELAAELNIAISASLFEKRAAGVYHNTSVMIDPAGQLLGRYRKMHIPDDPGFYEKFYFTPGDLGFQVLPAGGAGVGMLVCWDQWFPEAARLTAMQGADVLLYPTAIGWVDDDPPAVQQQQRDAWRTMHKAHAIANGVYVAAINRVGQEDDITFWGSSFVADPSGAVIAEASENEEEVLLAELDLSQIEKTRRGWPFLRDRRIDAYEPLTRRMVD